MKLYNPNDPKWLDIQYREWVKDNWEECIEVMREEIELTKVGLTDFIKQIKVKDYINLYIQDHPRI